MRRLLLLLLAASLLTACARKPETPAPPPPAAPAPPVTDPAVTPPPPASAEVGLLPDPAGGLGAVLKQAPAGTLKRITIAPGQPINREGLFFMKVATGEVEGWVFGDPAGYPSVGVSDDSRWLTGQREQTIYLANRASGVIHSWDARAASLVTVRGDVALFMTGTQFWVASGGLTAFQPVGVPAAHAPQALIAPDGKTAMLLVASKLYLVTTGTGQFREIGQVPVVESWLTGTLTATTGGVVVSAYTGSGEARRTLRYTWDGKLVADQIAPGLVYPSPDGKLVAWHDQLLNLTDTLTIGTPDFQPSLRLRGEMTCSLPYQGPYWLPDSSGLVVSTTRGPRILRASGALETPRLPEKAAGWGVPVPAPDRTDLFAYSGHQVVDGTGKLVAAAVLYSDGNFMGTGSSRLHPWGETSDEVRFSLRSSGKGVGCDLPIFPPLVEKAPFPVITSVEVKVSAGDCVNLRHFINKESPVVTCLPNGSRLVAAEEPGINSKGELRKWGNPAALATGGSYWWYVRTEKGERGWVYLDSEYLNLAAARPGEPAPDPVRNRLEDEVANLRYWFRVSLGEIPGNPGAYSDGVSLSTGIWGLISWCKEGPAGLRRLAGFDPARHGPGLAPIETTCQALLEAPKSLGELNEGPEWRQKVKELLSGLP